MLARLGIEQLPLFDHLLLFVLSTVNRRPHRGSHPLVWCCAPIWEGLR